MEDTFTPEQLEKLRQLKERVAGDLVEMPDDFKTDNELIRWLQARSFDLTQAEAMLRNHLAWRKSFDIDTFLERYQPNEILKKYWPGGLWNRRSRDGSLVHIEAVGVLDIVGLAKATSKEELKRFIVYKAALVEKLLKDEAKEKGLPAVGKVVLIQDLAHVSIRHLHPDYFNLLQEVLGGIIENYPERLKVVHFVNVPAPRLFAVGWNIAKVYFDDNIKGKFNFITDVDWRPTLKKAVAEEDLPVFLGGTVRDPDDRCSNTLGTGGMVPHDLYRGYDATFTKVTVPARDVYEAPVEVAVPGSLISWDFTTKDYDVKFGVFTIKEGRRTEVIKMERAEEAHRNLVSGWVVAERAGTYILEWDNRYSILRGKALQYKVQVIAPQRQEIVPHE